MSDTLITATVRSSVTISSRDKIITSVHASSPYSSFCSNQHLGHDRRSDIADFSMIIERKVMTACRWPMLMFPVGFVFNDISA